MVWLQNYKIRFDRASYKYAFHMGFDQFDYLMNFPTVVKIKALKRPQRIYFPSIQKNNVHIIQRDFLELLNLIKVSIIFAVINSIHLSFSDCSS